MTYMASNGEKNKDQLRMKRSSSITCENVNQKMLTARGSTEKQNPERVAATNQASRRRIDYSRKRSRDNMRRINLPPSPSWTTSPMVKDEDAGVLRGRILLLKWPSVLNRSLPVPLPNGAAEAWKRHEGRSAHHDRLARVQSRPVRRMHGPDLPKSAWSCAV